jgi:TonB family protein
MISKLKQETTMAIDAALPKDALAVVADFPKVFEKGLWEHFDKRFISVLAASLLGNFLIIAFLVMKAPQELSNKDIARIQDRFAKLVLDKQPPAEPEVKFAEATPAKELPPEKTVTLANQGSVRTSGGRPGFSTTTSAATSGIATGVEGGGVEAPGATGHRTREQISSDVSRSGILGLLTSNSGLASGDAAEDVLNDNNAPATNLDEALSKVSSSGLRRGSAADAEKPLGSSGGNGREVRGSRATNAGGIDALVQGLGEGRAQGVQRSGGLEVGSGEPLIEESEDGKATGSRDRDAVAAVVAKHTSAIQFCYQRELKRSPNLKGKVVVRFVITPQGAIESVTILSSTLSNATVESCIAERIKRWDDFGAIDPAKGNTTFRQVYTFGY